MISLYHMKCPTPVQELKSHNLTGQRHALIVRLCAFFYIRKSLFLAWIGSLSGTQGSETWKMDVDTWFHSVPTLLFSYFLVCTNLTFTPSTAYMYVLCKSHIAHEDVLNCCYDGDVAEWGTAQTLWDFVHSNKLTSYIQYALSCLDSWI